MFEKGERSDQIMIGSMEPNYCVMLGLVPYAEIGASL